MGSLLANTQLWTRTEEADEIHKQGKFSCFLCLDPVDFIDDDKMLAYPLPFTAPEGAETFEGICKLLEIPNAFVICDDCIKLDWERKVLHAIIDIFKKRTGSRHDTAPEH